MIFFSIKCLWKKSLEYVRLWLTGYFFSDSLQLVLQISDTVKVIEVNTSEKGDTEMDMFLLVKQVLSKKCEQLMFIQSEAEANCSISLAEAEMLIQVYCIATTNHSVWYCHRRVGRIAFSHASLISIREIWLPAETSWEAWETRNRAWGGGFRPVLDAFS